MSPAGGSLPLLEGIGLELEYMIVDRETLSVLPVADELLRAAGGAVTDEIEQGPLCWSNEMTLHLVELKTNGPVAGFSGLGGVFSADVGRINALLRPLGGTLMPSGMHPFMDPAREAVFWPHRNREIYEAYDRIFDCRRHGWANLQSAHVNLSFRGDEEFARLHAAVRLLLPILPALAAGSPVMEGRPTGLLDTRLEVYRRNQERIPSITGRVIPEAVRSRRQYRERILTRIYRDLAPHDPAGILRREWVNSRGAIPRFDRETIELRILDVQECPRADLAIAAAVVAALRSLVSGCLGPPDAANEWEIDRLETIFLATVRDGESAVLRDRRYLRAFGLGGADCTAGELWRHFVRTLPAGDDGASEVLAVILEHGTLARRILARLGRRPSRDRIRRIYRELCDCLAKGRLFLP